MLLVAVIDIVCYIELITSIFQDEQFFKVTIDVKGVAAKKNVTAVAIFCQHN